MSNKKSASELIFKAIFAAEKNRQNEVNFCFNLLEQKSLFSSADPHSNWRFFFQSCKWEFLSFQTLWRREEWGNYLGVQVSFSDFRSWWLCVANLRLIFAWQEHWATALQTLDLTLDEVVHIRTVLTKAELEGLPLDGSLKEDVEKSKVCFLCMKTRFGFFSRGVKCELCSRQVCAKCSTKVKKN